MKPHPTVRWHAMLLAFLVLLAFLTTAGTSLTLAHVASAVHWLYPAVTEITPQALAAQLGQPGAPLLLDAREADEFNISHLPGAIRVPPEASAAEVLALLGGTLPGKQVVLYCAVGGRSAVLTQRVQQTLLAAGATGVAHLRGGIFDWHTAGMPVISNNGRLTQQVHPYNWFWSRFLPQTGYVL